MRGAPKMRAMLPIIVDQVFLKQEKSLVWTYFPDEEVYVSAVLTEAGIDHAGLTARERSIIVKSFTWDPDKWMVLVMSYSVSSAGLNLQNLCHNLQFEKTAYRCDGSCFLETTRMKIQWCGHETAQEHLILLQWLHWWWGFSCFHFPWMEFATINFLI